MGEAWSFGSRSYLLVKPFVSLIGIELYAGNLQVDM